MVACQVRKDTSAERQTCDAVLSYTMGTHFHESVATAFVGHAAKQAVQCDRIWGRVVCGDCFVIDVVANGGTQAALVPESTEHLK